MRQYQARNRKVNRKTCCTKLGKERGERVQAHLDILGELIVAVDVDGRELPNLVELELDLDRLATRVVPPTDPTLRSILIVVGKFEVIGPRPAVRQLAQTALQLPVPVPVVGGVEEFPLVTPLIALGHRVRHDAICANIKRVVIIPGLPCRGGLVVTRHEERRIRRRRGSRINVAFS